LPLLPLLSSLCGYFQTRAGNGVGDRGLATVITDCFFVFGLGDSAFLSGLGDSAFVSGLGDSAFVSGLGDSAFVSGLAALSTGLNNSDNCIVRLTTTIGDFFRFCFCDSTIPLRRIVLSSSIEPFADSFTIIGSIVADFANGK
jgi:hypothetical protein